MANNIKLKEKETLIFSESFLELMYNGSTQLEVLQGPWKSGISNGNINSIWTWISENDPMLIKLLL